MAKPRALNTFLDGLAKIGINKQLVRNKKLLADLVLREYEMPTSSGSDDEYESDTSSQDNNEREVSEVEQDEGSESEDENDGDADKHSVDGEGTEDEPTSCQNCSSANLCHILVVKCPKCKCRMDIFQLKTN